MAKEFPATGPFIYPTLEFLLSINQHNVMPRSYRVSAEVDVSVTEEEVRTLHRVGRPWELWWSCPVTSEMGGDGVPILRVTTELAKSGYVAAGLGYPRIKSMRFVLPEDDSASDDAMSGEDTVPKSEDSGPKGAPQPTPPSSGDEAASQPAPEPRPGPSGRQEHPAPGNLMGSQRTRPQLIWSMSRHPQPEVVEISSSSDSATSPSLLDETKKEKN